MPNNEGVITIKNAQFLYRTNFGGDKDPYNDRGDRTFNVVLPEDLAEQLAADGWNVKISKPRKDATPEEREEFTPVPFLEVKVGYKIQPPRVVMKGNISRNSTELGEDTISILDDMEIERVDVMIRPYSWSVNDKSGVRAYLKTMYVMIVENELDLEWIDD